MDKSKGKEREGDRDSLNMEMFGVPMGMAKLYGDKYEYERVKHEYIMDFLNFHVSF